jgi:outer membrane protein assembly factor BamB
LSSGFFKIAGLAALLLLSGCDTFSGWIGDQESPPLPGKRISILSLEQQLEPDPDIADLQVRLPRPYVNANWPEAGGVPAHAMYHLEVGDALGLVWRAKIGAGEDDGARNVTSPVVAAGRVFALDTNSRLAAFDAATGERVWRVNLAPEGEEEGGFGGGVAYNGGLLFVTTGFGEVICLDPVTGNQYWRRNTGAPYRAAPTVEGDLVFALAYDNQLHALSVRTGELVWSHAGITETAGLLGGAAPAVSGGLVVVAYSSGEVFGLRAGNGQIAWGDTLSRVGRLTSIGSLSDINGLPVIDRGQVIVVGHAGRMAAIDMRTGRRVWDQSIGSLQTPWVAGDFIFLVTVDAEVICLSRRDGRIRWVRSMERFEDPELREGRITWAGPILASDRLIVVSSEGEAVSISPYDGSILGRVGLPSGVSVSPVVANETIYLQTDTGELVAIR